MIDWLWQTIWSSAEAADVPTTSQTIDRHSSTMTNESIDFSSPPFDSAKYAKSRIELHLHFDGSIRVSTICELANAKHLKITPHNTEEEIAEATSVDKPRDLAYFLSKLALYKPLLVGDVQVLERCAYELVEDEANQLICYFETRFSPHLLSNTVKSVYCSEPVLESENAAAVTPRDVVRAIGRGLKRGESAFGIKARMILCTIKGYPGWATEIVALADELRAEGVVAIDIAGDESEFTDEEKHAFQRAKQLGIHRTAHAGESGPASNVADAVNHLEAERIGHGYHVIDDGAIYADCRKRNIHFETCPYSSYLTGAVQPNERHAIVQFAEDNVNFSISKDDPTVTKSTMGEEYELLERKGLNEVHLLRANLNAARSCFLPPDEKRELLNHLYKIYGFLE